MAAKRNYLSFIILAFITVSLVNGKPSRIESLQSTVDEGGDIILKCHLDSAADVTKAEQVMFYKQQTVSDDNEKEIISVNFLTLGNFAQRPITIKAHTATEYELKLQDAQLEDNGEFGCVVAYRDGDSNREERISWTTVVVKREVQDIRVTAIAENGTEYPLEEDMIYRFTQRENYTVVCNAMGSIPQANVDFYFGDQKVTSQLFESSHFKEKIKDNEGAQDLITYTTSIRSRKALIVTDSMELRCRASITEGEGGQTFTFNTEFPYPPNVTCQKTFAGVTNKNVKLTCEISAFPDLHDHYWNITMTSGLSEIFHKDEGGNDYIIEDETLHNGKVRTTLTLLNPIQKPHFTRTFQVFAKNELGSAHNVSHLIHDPDMGAVVGDNSSARGSASLFLLIISLVCWTFIQV